MIEYFLVCLLMDNRVEAFYRFDHSSRYEVSPKCSCKFLPNGMPRILIQLTQSDTQHFPIELVFHYHFPFKIAIYHHCFTICRFDMEKCCINYCIFNHWLMAAKRP
jgi:hypothetical protein